MEDLKKLKGIKIDLPTNFEQSVWKSINARQPKAVRESPQWGELLWMHPAMLGGLACVVLLVGLALGQFQALATDNFSNQEMADVYMSSLTQGESVL